MSEKHTYTCKGCGKITHTYAEYQYGYICVKCRTKTKLTIKCSVCGTDFDISWDTYRVKDPSIPWRCRRCNDDYRNALYENKSDEEKKAFVESQKARSKAFWNNLSDEDKAHDSERRKNLWKIRRENGKAKFILDSMKAGREKWWNSLTLDERKTQIKIMGDARDKWWASLTPEQKSAHMRYPHEGFVKWWESLPDIQKKEFMNPAQNGLKSFWDNMTPEQYHEWHEKFSYGYIAYKSRMSSLIPNKNESSLIEYFNEYGIKFEYQFPSTEVHPDFYTTFPENLITHSKFVNPFHFWDFLVQLNDCYIFVDIDGSVHDPKNKTTGITEFNDSKRPYQTDGLDAYAILCYNDHLTFDTEVININTNSKMSFKDFLTMLCRINLTTGE